MARRRIPWWKKGRDFLSILLRNELIDFFCFVLVRLIRPVHRAKLLWYLLGGVVMCGGMGIIFEVARAFQSHGMSWSLVFNEKPVISALIVFVPTIVGTALFDLLFAICGKGPRMLMHRAMGLAVCATILLISAGMVFFCDAPNPIGARCVFGCSLIFWVVINADDEKFESDGCDDLNRKLTVDPKVKS